ncbi:MAG TPA: transglycosylase domain-containing protein [Solirubrobacteraceae bacterium]|nr:transglycosylase domain-containing protein [Solirubrobacteraceae bacterium]
MTRRERQRRRRKHAHPLRRAGLLGVVLVVSGVVTAVGLFALWVVTTANSAPNLSGLHARVPGQTSEVFAANDKPLGYLPSDVLRTYLSQAQQPTLLRQATVAIEDRRFYQHGGVDYEGLMRAALKDVVKGGGIQGGSTLTMQLVTNVYLPTDLSQQHNLKYKIVQAKLANELESNHSKNWILTQYLNDVPYGTTFGQTAIGVSAASEMFFDKPVQKLDLAQIALLAGLPQAPSEYNPFKNKQLATWRRGLVLQAMEQAGYITKAQEETAQAQPLQVTPNSTYQNIDQPYVFDYVEQQLVKDLGPDGQQIVDRGGLKIYTTINLADQKAAAQAIKANEGQPGDPASALVSVNPTNGHILALQNSTTYGTGKGQTVFDYATQAERQTGSAFKTFVLMTLIHDQDGNPNDTYYNSSPLAAGWLPGYPTYAVHNAEAGSLGDISVTRATALSVNAVYAQLGVDLGMSNVDTTAHEMGITAKLFGYPSEAIGGLRIGVSPLQMADAYATLANGGDHVPPTIIAKVVEPGGKTVNLGNPAKTQVFSQGEAYEGTQTLQTVLQYGTGTGASYGCPAAGKTGTTSNYTDAWFVGYTPQLSTAVWVGYPNSDVYMNDVNGLGPGYGGTLAAPIWKQFMQSASDGYCGDFPVPAQPWHGVEYFGKHAVSAYVPPVTTTATSTLPTTTLPPASTYPNGQSAITAPSDQQGIPPSTATTPSTPTPPAPPPASGGGAF